LTDETLGDVHIDVRARGEAGQLASGRVDELEGADVDRLDLPFRQLDVEQLFHVRDAS